MPLIIDDQTLQAAGLSEREALIEIACHLVRIGKLERRAAARLCGLDRIDLIQELGKRKIDGFGYTPADLEQDLQTLDQLFGRA